MLREGWSPPKVHLNVLSSHGGLGDQLARLPAFRHVHDTLPHVSQTIWVQDYALELVRYLMPEGPRLAWRRLSEAPYMLSRPLIEFDPNRVTSLALHLTVQAFLMMTDSLPPSREAMGYPRAPKVELPSWLPERLIIDQEPEYVVLTTDYTSRTRQWPSYHINALGLELRKHNFTPVLLGSTAPMITGVPNDDIKPRHDDGIDASLFIDLRGKTTLIEALGIMQRSKAVVGVDNGLLHLAHCTDVPVVYGLTTLKPEHRIPYRGIGSTRVIEAQVPCGGCQSRGAFVNQDWRECIFDDYACTLTLTSERFLEALKKLKILA